MENKEMTPAVPAEKTKSEAKQAITQEQLDELKKQGIELTPEEMTKLKSLVASGIKFKMNDDELTVAGGLSSEMKKALCFALATGIITAESAALGAICESKYRVAKNIGKDIDRKINNSRKLKAVSRFLKM